MTSDSADTNAPKEILFQGLRGVQGSAVVALLFREAGGDRPLIIGMSPHDAWKIMGILEEKSLREHSPDAPPEALSFALFVGQLLRTVGASVDHVLITGYDNHMWKSTVVLRAPSGEQDLVCRASDGVALALAMDAKTYATEAALDFAPPGAGPGPMGPPGPFGPPLGGNPFGSPGGPGPNPFGPFPPPGPQGGGLPGPFGPGGPLGPPRPPGGGLPGPFGPGMPPPRDRPLN